MDCGADGGLCQVLNVLFHDNEFASAVLAKWLGETGVLGAISGFLRDHGEKLIGLAGLSFGIYKWWRYRETILHKRLEEYLRENDRRLLDGQTYVLQALQRPAPGQRFKLPLFASKALQNVLRERNWDRTLVAANVGQSADWQLSKAIESIERRIEAADKTVGSLRQQLATAHIIKGAIASSGEPASSDGGAIEGSLDALTSFRSALQIPGHDRNLTAKELEAHQLRKLRFFAQAKQAYEDVQRLAATTNDYRTQRLAAARAKQHQAEIIQAQWSVPLPGGGRQFNGSQNAWALVNPNVSESALAIRKNFAPFRGWDLLDEGHLNYLAAFVAHNLGFNLQRQARLEEARTAYKGVLASPVRVWTRRSKRRLRQRAVEGLVRVETAQDNGVFDWRWLCQP